MFAALPNSGPRELQLSRIRACDIPPLSIFLDIIGYAIIYSKCARERRPQTRGRHPYARTKVDWDGREDGIGYAAMQKIGGGACRYQRICNQFDTRNAPTGKAHDPPSGCKYGGTGALRVMARCTHERSAREITSSISSEYEPITEGGL